MTHLRFCVLFIAVVSAGCKQKQGEVTVRTDGFSMAADSFSNGEYANYGGNGALLLTRFKSLDQLKEVIHFQYVQAVPASSFGLPSFPYVILSHRCGNRVVTNVLKAGVTEPDFRRARDGNFWDRFLLALHAPYAVLNKRDLMIVERLGRRRPWLYGKGDVAFYDLAESMVFNISEDDAMHMSSEDLSEKGYLNTFNHITAQALMTSIFSVTLADFVGDVHERQHSELISGIFTEDQLTDLEDGPMDNYIDLINNIWGQELGTLLRQKYSINRHTYWTPELLANYLNDIQSYYSWAFQIGFKPFRETDEIVMRFAGKINTLMEKGPN